MSLTHKKLTIINFIIVSYFVLLWFVNIYKIDYTLIGVFRELLTIPFLLAQIVFLILGIKFLTKNKINYFTIISLLLLAICTIITIGSFF